MLLQAQERDVVTSGVLKIARATVKASPRIFDFFANMTYANKMQAIVRELVANAIDAHTAAGKADVPVQVDLPTVFSPYLKVRDEGIGMSEEFMLENFMAYTDGSTKSNSNELIGGFGIGSKSPFAYTDQFTMRVVHNGTLSIYSVFKDSDGIPSIALLSQSTSNEANGVETSFPVELDDIAEFHEAAFTALAYFDPLPLISGTDRTLEAPAYILRRDNWGIRPDTGVPRVVMGGVAYPVKVENLSYDFRSGVHSELAQYGVDIYLPIGSVAVMLSREDLSYDKDTIARLEAELLEIKPRVIEHVSEIFQPCETRWEASKLFYDLTNNQGGTRGSFLSKHGTWRGEELTNFIKGYVPKWKFWRFEATGRKRRYYSTQKVNARYIRPPYWEEGPFHLTPGKMQYVVIDDLPKPDNARIQQWFADEVGTLDYDDSIIVLRHSWSEPDPWSVAAAMAAVGCPSDIVVFTSEMQPVEKKKRASSAKVTRPRVRMFTTENMENINRATFYVSKNGYGGYSNEIPYAEQPSAGIYVPMQNFSIVGQSSLKHALIHNIVDLQELYFLNAGDVEKLDETSWTSVHDVIEQRVAETLAGHDNQDIALFLKNSVPGRLYQWADIYGNLNQRQKSTNFGKLMGLISKYPVTLPGGFHQYVKVKAPKRVDVGELVTAILDNEPEIQALINALYPSNLVHQKILRKVL